MKKGFILLYILIYSLAISAQNESRTEYNFLRIPVSAHSAALGGDNISLYDDDASLMFSNPALLTNASDKTVGLNYMNYMQGANTLSASYNFIPFDRATAAFSGQYMDYGTMKESDSEGNVTGDFRAKDISLAGYLAYLLSDHISAGVTAKFITSYIGNYNSLAVGIDLGVNYLNTNGDFSVSLVAKNLGGQLKAYDDNYEPMPFDLQLGVSKRLSHTPLRLHATLVDLTHTSYKLKNHLVIGADLLLSESIWAGCGYNFRRASEMSIGTGDEESSHGAGFSLGAGINLERFGVNFSWGKYHVGNSSVIINLSYKL
jgi:hypothetical protein